MSDKLPLGLQDVYYFMPKWWCCCTSCVIFVGFWVLFSGFVALGTAEFEGNKRDEKVQSFNSAVTGWDYSDYAAFVSAIGATQSSGSSVAVLPTVNLNVSRGQSETFRVTLTPLPVESSAFDVFESVEHPEDMLHPDTAKNVYYTLDEVPVLPPSAIPGTVQLQPSVGGVLQVHHTADMQVTFPPPEDSALTTASILRVSDVPTVISVLSNDPLCSDEDAEARACPQRCDSAAGFALSSKCVHFFRAEAVCFTAAPSGSLAASQNTSRLFGMTGTNAVVPGSAPPTTPRIGCAQQHPWISRSALQRAGVTIPPSFARLMVPGTSAVMAVRYQPIEVPSLSSAFSQNTSFPQVAVTVMADAAPYAAAMRTTDGSLDFGTPAELIVGAAAFLIGFGLVVCCCGSGVCICKWSGARAQLAGYASRAASQGFTPEQLMAVVRDQDRVLASLPKGQRDEFRLQNGLPKWLRMLQEQNGYVNALPVGGTNPLGGLQGGHQPHRQSAAAVAPAAGGIELGAMSRSQSMTGSHATKEQATIATMPGHGSSQGAYTGSVPAPQGPPAGDLGGAYPIAAPSYMTPQYAPTQTSFGAYVGADGASQARMVSGPYYPPPAYNQGGGNLSMASATHK